MQTRREQVRAYRFVTRRIVSALLSGEPESLDLPMRRFGMALVGSLLVAAILLGGVGAYGLLHPNGGTPPDNSLVIERETGARYVYIDSTLFPVFNFASALLILGTADPTVETMSRTSLRALPRSRQTYGIASAPDSLPDPAALSGLPWTVCSSPSPTDPATQITRVMVGSRPAGGTDLGDSALLVKVTDTNTVYMLWHDHALHVAGPVTQAALGMAGVTPLPVGSALINGTVAGPDLRIPSIDGDGSPGTRSIDGQPVVIGSVYHDEHGQHYVMLKSGLATIGEPMADLIKATGKTDNIISSAVAGGMQTNQKVEPDGFPPSLPKILDPGPTHTALCTMYTTATGTEFDSTVLLYNQVPAELVPAAGDATVQTNRSIRTADFVTVTQGALVRPVSAPGADSGDNTAFLVTSQGIRYALETRSGDATAALGYSSVTPSQVPLSLLELIPLGPTLDIAVARRPPTQPAGGPSVPTGASPSPSPSPKPTT